MIYRYGDGLPDPIVAFVAGRRNAEISVKNPLYNRRVAGGAPLYAIKFETRYISRMNKPRNAQPHALPEPATWDARLARRLVTPLIAPRLHRIT